MSEEIAMFLGSVALLVNYLIFSAKTEMGTKLSIRWPWRKR